MAYPPPNFTIPELQRLDLQRFQTLPEWKQGIVRIGSKFVLTDEVGRFIDHEGKIMPSGADPVLRHSVYTGFIVNNGLVVTAAHGVCNWYHADERICGFRLRSLEITDIAGQPLPRSVIVDVVVVDTGVDLALLRVPAEINVTFAFRLAVTENVQVGQSVHTFGHPYIFPWDSDRAVLRIRIVRVITLCLTLIKYPQSFLLFKLISLPPGFSGGPLIALSGEVIGVNQSITTIEEEISTHRNNLISFSVPVRFINGLLCWYLTGGQRGREMFFRNDGIGQYHIHLVEYAKRKKDPSLAHVLAADEERVIQGLHE